MIWSAKCLEYIWTFSEAYVFRGCQYGWTALIRSSCCGHLSTVKVLLAAGANPDVKDNVRMTLYCME